MSRRTVKTHLSHIYAKLAVANRTELTAAGTNLCRWQRDSAQVVVGLDDRRTCRTDGR